MPCWHLSLPLPATPTSPSRLQRSSSPIAVDLPSHRPLMLSCSRALHRHPSPRHPSPPSCHRTVHIHPPPLQTQSIAVTLVLSLTAHRTLPSKSRRTIHCHQGAVTPSIAVAPLRPSLSRSRQSLSIRLLLSSCRRSVHCCPLLLSCRRAIHRCRTATSITVKLPSRRPLPSIAIAITVHQRCARAIPHRPLKGSDFQAASCTIPYRRRVAQAEFFPIPYHCHYPPDIP